MTRPDPRDEEVRQLRERVAELERRAGTATPAPPASGDTPADPARRQRALLVWVAVSGLVTVAGVVAVVFVIGGPPRMRVEGALQIRDGAGAWTFSPTRCLSGDGFRPSFEGVDLQDGAGRQLHVVARPAPSVALMRSDGQPVVLQATGCKVLDATVSWGPLDERDVARADGRLRVDCSLPDGAVSGTIRFESCGR